jgi:hypothetical protein
MPVSSRASMGMGKLSMAGARSCLLSVPMLPVGHATTARSAAAICAPSGCCRTKLWSFLPSKVPSATQRQVPQSMQPLSTKKSPGTLVGRALCFDAMPKHRRCAPRDARARLASHQRPGVSRTRGHT